MVTVVCWVLLAPCGLRKVHMRDARLWNTGMISRAHEDNRTGLEITIRLVMRGCTRSVEARE